MLRKFALSLIAASAAIAIPSVAIAQDAPEKPFEGFYIGASGGYDVQPNDVGSQISFDRNLDGTFGDTVSTSTGANAFSPGFCNGRANGSGAIDQTCTNDGDGWSYYGRVGYDRQFGALVIGIVGEFGKTEIVDSVSAFSTTPASYTLTRKVDWEASERGRVGFAARNTLFYGTGGVGYARINNIFTTTNTANTFTGNGNDNRFGYVVGGGIEQKISKHISFGLEYSLHSYADGEYRVRATQGTAAATNPFVLAPNTAGTDFARTDDNFRWHSLRATLAFRF